MRTVHLPTVPVVAATRSPGVIGQGLGYPPTGYIPTPLWTYPPHRRDQGPEIYTPMDRQTLVKTLPFRKFVGGR